jgi:DNA mismatch repair ATPase MutS
MTATVPSETEALPSSRTRTASDTLVLDAHTFKDLEVFESQARAMSLFQFCNLSRTDGGAKVLRRRMEQPWSNAARIRAERPLEE